MVVNHLKEEAVAVEETFLNKEYNIEDITDF